MAEELARAAAEAARQGAAALCRRFRDRGLEVRAKAEHDYVSTADRESEAAIVAFLQQRFPDHGVLTEEAGRLGTTSSDYEWVVDPLDGTNNFLQGLPIWAVSIACRRRQRLVAGAIYDPLGENLFTAAAGSGARWNDRPMRVSERRSLKGAFIATGYPFRARAAVDAYLQVFRAVFLQARAVRRCGAAALDLAYTAAGVYDGFFEFRLSPWDIAAGALMIEEAGGRVSDLGGGEGYLLGGNVVAGCEPVQRELLAAVAAHAGEELLDRLAPLDRVVVGE